MKAKSRQTATRTSDHNLKISGRNTVDPKPFPKN